jgi:hypothetical protein
MDLHVRSLNGNRVFYEFPTEVGAVLCHAFPETFSRRSQEPEPTPAPPTNYWLYSCQRLQSGLFALQRARGAAVEYCSASPDSARAYWPEIPQDVLDAWAATRPSERIQ